MLDEHNVAIHGVSFAKPQAPESLLPKYHAPTDGAFNIGLLHTSLAGAVGHDTYAPCNVSDLQAHGFDYWALGHVHIRAVHSEQPHVVMPGMPQGRDIGEAGPKSVTLAIVDSGKVTLEEHITSSVEFNRVSCSLDDVDDWRDALEEITRALKLAAMAPSDHSVLRLSLEGATSLAWRLRRDQDLLTEQVINEARAIGSIWIEKIENSLTAPLSGDDSSDARSELQSIMRDLMMEEPFTSRAAQTVEDLIGDLPPEIRSEFGESEEERQTVVQTLLAEGVEEMTARMMADHATGGGR